MAAIFPQRKEQLIYLINNYDMVLGKFINLIARLFFFAYPNNKKIKISVESLGFLSKSLIGFMSKFYYIFIISFADEMY